MSKAAQLTQQIAGTTTGIQKKNPTTIAGMLDDPRYKLQIAKALPKHMDTEHLSRTALTEIRKNPELGKCDAISLFGAIIQCAQLGLEPGSVLGHAYLLPFRNTKENRTDVQFIVGYRGMIDLARRSGQIVSLQAHSVYEGDKFDFAYGLDEKLEHVPTSDIDNRGEMIAVYAVAKLQGGGYQIEVMWKKEVDLIRAQSKAGNFGPWKTHYEEMAKKTVIRRLFKYLPVSVEVQTAATLDERAESGISQDNHFIIDEEIIIEHAPSQETGEQ
jgi:recombination protein RecT